MKESNNDDLDEEEQIKEEDKAPDSLNKENINQDQKLEAIITGNEQGIPLFLSKVSSESLINDFDSVEMKQKEKTREIHNSYLYNTKDYLFFFSLMISSSMNFSYPYYPIIILGIILFFLIGKNSIINKSRKSRIEIISLIYSAFLLVIKIACLFLIINDNEYISKNKDRFLDYGICYLRKDGSSFYFIMTFLGEAIITLFSLYSIFISRKCYNFSRENDTSLMKNTFWTCRKLITLNFIFILNFAVFNHSFSTLLYMSMLQILLFLSSIKINENIFEELSKKVFSILKYFILIQIVFINIFNVPKLQENYLYQDEIKDKDGNIKIFSIFTKIGINYAYNENISYVWKEWIGYLSAILSLMSLTYSLNNLKINELGLIHKISSISLEEAKTLLIENEENNAKNEQEKKLIKMKRKVSKGISSIKKIFEVIFDFITSSVFIIQLCRIMSIFYIYFYPNFFSIGIFITLFFSSLYTDVNRNKKLTLFLLVPSVTITTIFYHISNINGIFENLNDIRRKQYLNFALGKYEYSFLEYYAHNLFFIFIMSLIYSFYNPSANNRRQDEKNLILNDDFNAPLLDNSIENDVKINMYDEPELNLKNLFIKLIFTHIDKITLIAMYFVSMRSINLIHLVLVVIFLIQILMPKKIQKMYKYIIIILQLLFFIELVIHLLKAYYFENFNESKDEMNFILIYTDKITNNDMELSIYLVLYCFYFQYQFDNFHYIKSVMNSREILWEKYMEKKLKKLLRTKYMFDILIAIISNIYIWILIGLFFVISCYYEINFIFAVKLGYFLFLTFIILRKIQNHKNEKKPTTEKRLKTVDEILRNENKLIEDENEDEDKNLIKEKNDIIEDKDEPNNDKIFIAEDKNDSIDNRIIEMNKYNFSYSLHYIFLIFCSLNSFLVYLYQFRENNFIYSKTSDLSNDNFFTKNLPNIGFSIYLKDNLYLNFLPHFGLTFIAVLFIDEIQRQLKNMKKKDFKRGTTMMILNKKKAAINKKLENKDLSEEDKEILKSDIYIENETVLKYLTIKYFFINLIKIFSEFYWLFLFLSMGIIFSFYDMGRCKIM